MVTSGIVLEHRDLVGNDLLQVVVLTRLEAGDACRLVRHRDELDLIEERGFGPA